MSVELRKRVGANARDLRVAGELTGTAAAEKLGIDDRYLRRLEAGRFNLELDSLARLAKFYGVDPSVLLRPRRKPLPKRKAGRPLRTMKKKR